MGLSASFTFTEMKQSDDGFLEFDQADTVLVHIWSTAWPGENDSSKKTATGSCACRLIGWRTP
jgi:hypothetical protein